MPTYHCCRARTDNAISPRSDATLRDQMEAATWLADRGSRKPVQALEPSGKDGEPLIPVDLTQAVVAG